MRAELLADSITQHLLRSHPESCVLESCKEIVSCILSARNTLRRRFGLKQWTLTLGAYDHQNFGKTPKTRNPWYDTSNRNGRITRRKWACVKN